MSKFKSFPFRRDPVKTMAEAIKNGPDFQNWVCNFISELVASSDTSKIIINPSGRGCTIPLGSSSGDFNKSPFAVNVILVSTGPDVYEVSINASTVQGDTKTMANKTSGSGDIWATVAIDDSTGVVSSPVLTSGASAPSSSSTTIVWPIATYDFSGSIPTASNYRYGPLYATSERLYYINPAEWAFNPN